MKFKGTLIITDPCYIDSSNDKWGESGCGKDLSVYGCKTYISKSTLYGDWSCTTFKGSKEDVIDLMDKWNDFYFNFFARYNTSDDKDKELLKKEYKDKEKKFLLNHSYGMFCADSGTVCVILAEELNNKDSFLEWVKKHSWCATIIPDFDGNVEYVIDNNESVHIVGTGNKPFYTSQTGL